MPNRQQRTFTQEELIDRLFLPMLVEASRTLMEGIVRDPGDVDMGLDFGHRLPAVPGRHPALGRYARPRQGARETQQI